MIKLANWQNEQNEMVKLANWQNEQNEMVKLANWQNEQYEMSRDARKSVLGIFDQARHKPAWTVTEES